MHHESLQLQYLRVVIRNIYEPFFIYLSFTIILRYTMKYIFVIGHRLRGPKNFYVTSECLFLSTD